MKTIEGQLVSGGRKLGIVAARFNSRIVDLLIGGATDCFLRHGAGREDLSLVRVPGAWEVPLALHEMAKTGRYDGLVALAVVIRGETPHFDYVCSGCSQGVARVSQEFELPIGFGVLTCDSSSQAVERAGGKAGNKGWDAAMAVLEMADLQTQIRSTTEASKR